MSIEIPSYRAARSTIKSITSCVRQYTSDAYVNQICAELEKALLDGDAEATFMSCGAFVIGTTITFRL